MKLPRSRAEKLKIIAKIKMEADSENKAKLIEYMSKALGPLAAIFSLFK